MRPFVLYSAFAVELLDLLLLLCIGGVRLRVCKDGVQVLPHGICLLRSVNAAPDAYRAKQVSPACILAKTAANPSSCSTLRQAQSARDM